MGKDILFPLVGQALGATVVTGKPVDTRFNEDKSVFGILILAALLEVASDVHGLLDQAINILGDFRCTS